MTPPVPGPAQDTRHTAAGIQPAAGIQQAAGIQAAAGIQRAGADTRPAAADPSTDSRDRVAAVRSRRPDRWDKPPAGRSSTTRLAEFRCSEDN